MIPLYSSHYKQIATAHKYKTAEENRYDTIALVLPSNLIKIFVVDRQAEVLIKMTPMPYLMNIFEYMSKNFPDVNWDVHRFECFTIEENKSELKFYGFLFLTDLANKIYTFKIESKNLLDDNPVFNISFVNCLSQIKYTIAGLLLKENLIYNDYQTIDTVNAYIMYIDTSENDSLSGKPVLGKQILITEQEKEQFKKNHPNIDITNQDIVVNCWDKPIYLYILPDQTEKVQFQFTNGLLYVRFTEPDFELHEHYKI